MTAHDSDSVSGAPPGDWPGWFVATAICMRFFSRLPVPRLPGEGDVHALPDFRAIPRALPIAGLAIALPAAMVMLAAGSAGVSATLAAALAVTALVLTTGALHEDGLADAADGLFGGATPERRLEIMKDSRVGTFGALALCLSLLLRVTALAAILGAAGSVATAAAMLCAASGSRAMAIALMARMVPARPDGASAAVGRPSERTGLVAILLALVSSAGLAWAAGLPLAGLCLGYLIGLGTTTWLARTAQRLIGGQTGDIIGAAQQLGEIALYLGFAIALGWSIR